MASPRWHPAAVAPLLSSGCPIRADRGRYNATHFGSNPPRHQSSRLICRLTHTKPCASRLSPSRQQHSLVAPPLALLGRIHIPALPSNTLSLPLSFESTTLQRSPSTHRSGPPIALLAHRRSRRCFASISRFTSTPTPISTHVRLVFEYAIARTIRSLSVLALDHVPLLSMHVFNLEMSWARYHWLVVPSAVVMFEPSRLLVAYRHACI